MPDAQKIDPADAKAYAVLRGRDGKRIVAHTQREVDDAVKAGAVADGPTWGTRRNRREMRALGRHNASGTGRARRQRAGNLRYDLGPLVTPLDHNGRPMLPARRVETPEQRATRKAGNRAAKVARREARRA